MLKFGAIVVGLLLLASATFAQNGNVAGARVEILMDGKTISVKLPKGAASVSADKMVRKADGTLVLEVPTGPINLSADRIQREENTVTLSGKVAIGVQQEKRQAVKITADEAVLEWRETAAGDSTSTSSTQTQPEAQEAELKAKVLAVEEPKAEKQPTVATVQVAGKTIATLEMVDGAVLSIKMGPNPSFQYDPKKKMMIYTGKCTLEARQGDKRLLQLVVDDGVVTIGPLAMLPDFLAITKEAPKSKAKP